MLTARQQAILDFMKAYHAQHREPPTMRTIMVHLGIKSTNGVRCHFLAMEKKGVLTQKGSRRWQAVDNTEPRAVDLLRRLWLAYAGDLPDLEAAAQAAGDFLRELLLESLDAQSRPVSQDGSQGPDRQSAIPPEALGTGP
jgi:SOS-response transcriptional repressor LexA